MRRGTHPGKLAFLSLALLALSGIARAQEGDITVTGTLQGELRAGERLTFLVTAAHQSGWEALHEISVTLALRGAPLETVVYDVDDQRLSIGTARAVAGTANELRGRFLRMRGFDVAADTGGSMARVGIEATLVAPLPEGTRVSFAALDDQRQTAEFSRALALPEDSSGFSWGTLIVAALGALLLGGVVGARVGAHRRPPTRPSVYAALRRRLDEAAPVRPREAGPA